MHFTTRKYSLIKVQAADYLLPSNDRQTLFRIARDAQGHWDLFRYRERLSDQAVERFEPDDWSDWECIAQLLPTRREAIDEAMRVSAA